MRTNLRYLAPVLLVAALSCAGQPAVAQQSAGSNASIGRVTDYEAVRREKIYEITRARGPIQLDGFLDDPAWEGIQVEDEFFQVDPGEGVPATERTEFRLVYDDDYIYVAIVCYQEGPVITSGLQRDFTPPADGDAVAIMFDTFDNDRDAFFFITNPGGAKRDQQTAGGVRSNEWDGVYDVATRIDGEGWYAEFAIPFTTLRFDDRPQQQWGLNLLRIIRHKNEWMMWTPARRPLRIFDVFVGGSMTGLEGLRQGRNLQIKPFAVSNYRPDFEEDRFEADAGVDIKYGLNSSLTLDVTFNTDFSQVDADTQQVNLTRFSLFFPEQRDFFLENAGLFNIGGSSGGSAGGGGGGRGGGGGGGGPGGGGGGNDFVPFFSRRIGLSDRGEPLPIIAGARMTGRLGGFDVGLMNIQVGKLDASSPEEEGIPSDNWTVMRTKRDVADSDVGTFFFNRRSGGDSTYWSRAVGADFNLRFIQRKLNISGYGMNTYTPGDDEDNFAGNARVSFSDNFYNLRTSYLTIQEGFQNDFGFIRRPATRKTNVFASVRPRPGGGRGLLREVSPQFNVDYITDQENRLLTRTQRAGVNLRFRDGDSINVNRNMRFEHLGEAFVLQGVEISAGDYAFNDWSLGFRTSGGRRLSGSMNLTTGDFWTGTRRQLRTGVAIRPNIHLNSRFDWSRNTVKLTEGTFTTDLIGVRLNFAFSPRVFLENFFQYNTAADTISTNIRFRFLHHPLSDFFIVYNERRGVSGNDLLDRTLSIKLTNLFVF